MNKRPGHQQLFLQADWYTTLNEKLIIQDMPTMTKNPVTGKSSTE